MDENTLDLLLKDLGMMAQSISQLNHDYTALSLQHSALATNVEWLMKFFWIIATASIGSFIATVWMLITRRNNK